MPRHPRPWIHSPYVLCAFRGQQRYPSIDRVGTGGMDIGVDVIPGRWCTSQVAAPPSLVLDMHRPLDWFNPSSVRSTTLTCTSLLPAPDASSPLPFCMAFFGGRRSNRKRFHGDRKSLSTPDVRPSGVVGYDGLDGEPWPFARGSLVTRGVGPMAMAERIDCC